MPATPWLADALLVLLRWLHGLAAVALLGWVLTFLLLPASIPTASAFAPAQQRFKEIADGTLLVFLATGAVLSFDRLSHGAGVAYAVVLGLKILLAVGAYQYALRWRKRGMRRDSLDGRLVLALGAGAILMAAILKGLFERGVRGDFL